MKNGKKYKVTVKIDGSIWNITGVYNKKKHLLKCKKGTILTLNGDNIELITFQEIIPKKRQKRKVKVMQGTIGHWLIASKQIK